MTSCPINRQQAKQSRSISREAIAQVVDRRVNPLELYIQLDRANSGWMGIHELPLGVQVFVRIPNRATPGQFKGNNSLAKELMSPYGQIVAATVWIAANCSSPAGPY